MMYFSRVRIEPGSMDRMKYIQLIQGDMYSMHQLIWKLFPSDSGVPRSFLFRQEYEREQLAYEANKGNLPIIYLLSEKIPVSIDGLLQVTTKEYSPKVETGMRLGFDARVNPIIARKTEGKNHSVKHDVMMNAKYQAQQTGLDSKNPVHRTEIDRLVHDAVINWFAEKSKVSGFTFDRNPEFVSVEVEGYRQNYLRKRGKENISFSSVDLSGSLSVTDPDLFKQTLQQGIGHSRSFGCGLMLIRRLP